MRTASAHWVSNASDHRRARTNPAAHRLRRRPTSAVARRLAKDQRAAAFNGVSLSPSQAQAYAAEYLAASGASREFSGLSIDSVDVSDGESVRIRLRGRIHPPLVSIVVPDGIEVSANSSARLNTKQTN